MNNPNPPDPARQVVTADDLTRAGVPSEMHRRYIEGGYVLVKRLPLPFPAFLACKRPLREIAIDAEIDAYNILHGAGFNCIKS